MRILAVAGAFWLLTLVVLTSDAGVGIIGFYVLLYGGIALGACWAVLVGRWIRARRRDPESASASTWRWYLVPAILLGSLVLSAIDGPNNPLFRVRFQLSRTALTREAQRLLNAPDGTPARRRVGLFRVERSDVIDGQVRFITTTCGVIDSCGVVYSPVNEPRRWQEDRFSPLGDRWWHLFEGF